MPAALGIAEAEEDLGLGSTWGLADLALSGPAVRVAEGMPLELDLFAAVAQDVISRCCEDADGLLEGNNWVARVGLLTEAPAGAPAPLALSLALPSMVSEDADVKAEAARYRREGVDNLVRKCRCGRRLEDGREWVDAEEESGGRRARTRVTPAFIQKRVGDA